MEIELLETKGENCRQEAEIIERISRKRHSLREPDEARLFSAVSSDRTRCMS